MFVQVSTIEFSLVEVSVVHGLKQGNEVLKEIHKEMNLESVEKLLEETAEAREYQRVRSIYHAPATDISSFSRKSAICLRTLSLWTMKTQSKTNYSLLKKLYVHQ